jgi:hypothetical protein
LIEAAICSAFGRSCARGFDVAFECWSCCISLYI